LRYLGLIGSRAKVARIYDQLAADQMPADFLQHVHAPIGLDIGADQPAEIALSILAEIVGWRSGRLGADSGALLSIGDRPGPIHPELAPGEATCPGG
jgi:xanthine dehydrogenase accessory factor